MNFKKSALALVLGTVAGTSAFAANSLEFQGVTFNTWAVDADTLGLSIVNADHATGDWTGISFLKSFEIKNIVTGGEIASASISGPGIFTASVTNGMAANGCTTGNTKGACFTSSPALALSPVMSWTIDFTATAGGTLNFNQLNPQTGKYGPHLKVLFLDVNDRKTGDLLSQSITPVPEPETYAMLLAGLGLMGAIARRRKNAA